jgi:NADH dehydrogenase [ubiquinone] 1 alpha subcomplex assembly factor 7
VSALAQQLTQRIRASGPLSVADYMDAVSSFYYGTRDPFGAAGDFITAPEISQMFGELIGLWCAEFWQRIGAPKPVLLVELGPGRGTLMADALRATRIVPSFLEAAQLHLVERSPSLRRMQAEKLHDFTPQWHDGVATLPAGPLLLIANEFLDALPIRQFERRNKAWHERRIALAEDGESLTFALDPQPSLLAAHLPACNEGAIAELCPPAAALGAGIGARLARDGGAALFIDYGYTAPACGDTLQALRRHQPQSVLDKPGEADLTAHVDFAHFAEAARAGGATVYGPITQRVFLQRLGVAARAATLMKNAPAQAEAIHAALERLIGASAMGSLFKVLALTRPGAPAPAGFEEEA